jgi:hypothetical protein
MIDQNEKFVFWSAVKPDLSNLQWKERMLHQEGGGGRRRGDGIW